MKLFVAAWFMVALPIAASAEDVVIVRGKPPQGRVQRRGEIVEWLGAELRLRTGLGREEVIPTADVLEVRSDWLPSQVAAEKLRAEGQVAEAVAQYEQAQREERRPWVRRRIAAELVVAHLELGHADLAGDEFLQLIASDPATLMFDVAPLAWRGAGSDAGLQARATAWLADGRSPVGQLLGASWSLSGEQRAAAIEVLERLASGSDRRIAAAAEIQLWRTKIVTARLDDVQRWQRGAERVPAELRGGAYYQIGEALARLGKSEEASLAYLQTALTYNRQRALAADALVAAAGQLAKLGRPEQAASLYREVVRDYGATAAATAAAARLAEQ